MITLKEVRKDINFLANENLAEKWDNVGLMVGCENQKIKKILLCLDVTRKVVEEAIEKNIDLIISHHPLIFKSIKNLDFSNFKSDIIRKLIKNDIAVISAHTNLDSSRLGLNDYLAKLLNLEETKVLFPNENNSEFGLGRIGKLNKELSIDEFIEYTKLKLDLNYVKLISENSNVVSSVAILGGSGGSFISNLPKVDIFLTGDISYHDAIDAIEVNQNLLDIGHFAEKASKQLIYNYLKNLKKYEEIEIHISKVEKEPFEIR